VCVYIYI
jgi:hypothetical protein